MSKREGKIKLLENLIANVKREREFKDKFFELFGDIPGNSDTCLYRFVGALVKDQIQLVAALIGDTENGLNWFIYENDCGAKGYEAGIDGDLRPIRTIDDYLWLVNLEVKKS